MLEVAQSARNVFHNFKCGEIFYISPAVYNVTCCLCAIKMHLDQFPSHFQMQHLTLAEESINLEDMESERDSKVVKDDRVLDNMAIKEVYPQDDPIKEDFDAEINEDDKSLQQLLRETQNARNRLENVQQSQETGNNDFTASGAQEVGILPRKSKTRNSKKKQTKRNNSKAKDPGNEILFEVSSYDAKDKLDLKVDLTKEDELNEGHDNDNVEMDKDWSLGDKVSDTDSDDDHVNELKDELPYPCHICKRSYRSKHGLQIHNYSAHNPKKPPKKSKESKAEHKCDQCDKVFRLASLLRAHKWKHTGIFCDICGRSFTQPSNLIRHKIRHTGIKAHKCNECNKQFFTDKELQSHMICHTGLMPCICEICGRRCRHRGMLTAHMRRHTGERPAKCDVCGKSFFSFHDLNVHAVTHSSERPFKCDICESTFQRKKALRIHKLIHSKDRKHICKICGKGFAQSGGLNSHMRTHDTALEKLTDVAVQQTPVPVFFDNSVLPFQI